MSASKIAFKRFRYIATVQKGKLPLNGDSSGDLEMVPYLTMEYLRGEIAAPLLVQKDSRALMADDGDLLLLWDGSNAGEFFRAKRGLVSTTSAVVIPRGIDCKYFYWACKAFEYRIRAETVGMGIPHVNTEYLANLDIPVPEVPRQQAIADYLDRETARIDALIAAKERLLALLAEKRQALITRAVTRGLDPNVPLRDSGVPWLGMIPAHWKVVRLRFLVQVMSGATPDTGKSEYWDGEIPWVSPKDMKRDEIADSEDHVTSAALTDSALRLVPIGAVLVVVRGMILAHSFPVALTVREVTINQDMKALLCRGAICPQYLRDFLRAVSRHVVSLADSSAHGTRKLETEILGQLLVCVPPMEEQVKISTHVAVQTAELDRLSTLMAETIALLKERRAALIAAAVTGQIHIPSEAVA